MKLSPPPLTLVGALSGLMTGAISSPTVAHAADTDTAIPKIGLTPSGPTATFPLQKPFYVTGKAAPPQAGNKKPLSVYAVFVRYWWGGMGARPTRRTPRNCSEVEDALAPYSANSLALSSGKNKVEEIWPATTAKEASYPSHYQWLRRWGKVLVAEGKIDDKVQFEVLVNNPSFFHYGAHYCVFVYQSEQVTTESISTKLFKQTSEALSSCDEDNPDDKSKRLKCRKEAAILKLEAFKKALGEQFKEGAEVDKAIGELMTTAQTAVVPAQLKIWEDLHEVAEVSHESLHPSTSPYEGLLPAKVIELVPRSEAEQVNPAEQARKLGRGVHASFANIVLELLVRKGMLAAPYETEENKIPIRLFVLPGKFEVHAVQFLDKGDGKIQSLRLYGPPVQEGERLAEDVEVSLTKLTYPDSNLTLADLVTYVYGSAELTKLEKLKESKNTRDSVFEQAANVKALATEADKRATLIDRTRGTQRDTTDADLRLWLKALCAKHKDTCETEGTSPPIPTWLANYARLIDLLSGLQDAYATLDEFTDDLVKDTKNFALAEVELGSEISPTLSLDYDDYFHQYVSGFAGLSATQYATGELALLPYAGAHVFFWPNEVTQPMWSNGPSDVRRMLGLEYGIRLGSGDFGPDKRYRGIVDGSLPMMFVGGLAQFVPYVFISGGATFSGYRRSVLEQERAQNRIGWYVGVSVDINLVGFVQRLIQEAPTTAATPATNK